MPAIEKKEIENQLKNIVDPNVETDLVSAGSVKSITVEDGNVTVNLELGYPAKSFIEGFYETSITIWVFFTNFYIIAYISMGG